MNRCARLAQALVAGILLAAQAQAFPAEPDGNASRLRRIVLQSQQLGAHGMGYGERSLDELSRKIAPADIPALISLGPDRELRTGARFALASQCAAAIPPVRDAAVARRMDFAEASEVMRLVAAYKKCPPAEQQRAREAESELDAMRREDQAKAIERARREKEEDARIQRNAGTMVQGRAQAQTLSRAEREEVYRRSLKAMGLAEDAPLTPQQKDLVDRMYRSMVLGEPGASSNAQPR